MTLLIDLAIRSSVMLAAGLLLATLLRTRAAALRHCVLAGAVAAAAAVVPLSLALPSWKVSLPSSLQAPALHSSPIVETSIIAATPSTPPAVPRRPIFPLGHRLAGGVVASAAMLLTALSA